MSKRENSKYKIDRRLRVNLWGRPKSPINKREYGPGQHGQGRQKPTDYRLQLMAKQRLKGYYGSVSSVSSAATILRPCAARATPARTWSRSWSAGWTRSSTA